MRALLDTSVFVARETGRTIRQTPDDAAISVMTLAELELGVLSAGDEEIQARRRRTLTEVAERYQALPVDGRVASAFAQIVAAARRRGRRPHAVDTLIAATAAVHGVPLYTQDADFEGLPGIRIVRI